MPRLKAANLAKSPLAQAMTAAQTSCVVEDASLFPDEGPFRIVIDAEVIEVGSINKGTNTLSDLIRGVEDTVPATHEVGAMAENRFTAGTFNELIDKTEFDSKSTSPGGTEPNRLAMTGGDGAVGLAALAQALDPDSVDFQQFTSSGTWNKPDNVRWVLVDVISGGGGGSGGGTGSGNRNREGGSGGGGGGRVMRLFRADQVPSSVSVIVGAGGSGGPGGTDRSPGGHGGNSSFGDLVSVLGGRGGRTSSVSGSEGGGVRHAPPNTPGMGSVGAGSNPERRNSGYFAEWGGGSGASWTSDVGSGHPGGASLFGGGGGGSGGSPSSSGGSTAARNGGEGGGTGISVINSATGGGGSGGVNAAGGNGYDGNLIYCGAGGGGGAGRSTSGLPGGDGGVPGGGGGGGGGGSSSSGGDGGDGARGEVRVWAW